jgi:DHA2 family multidrug resistance protein
MRPVVCAGIILAASQVFRMSHWTIAVRESEVLLPIFLFGLGLGGVFPIITALGVGQVSRERMGFASSLFAMMINTGAAAGIAVATSLLTTRHRHHEAQLRAILSAPNLLGNPKAQAWLFAYNDVYRATAVLLLLLAPWIFLLKRAEIDSGPALGSE